MQSSSVNFSGGVGCGGKAGLVMQSSSVHYFLGGKVGRLKWNRSPKEPKSLQDKHLMIEKLRGTCTTEGMEKLRIFVSFVFYFYLS